MLLSIYTIQSNFTQFRNNVILVIAFSLQEVILKEFLLVFRELS